MLSSVLLASIAVLGWAAFMYLLKPLARLSFIGTPLRTLAYFIALTVFIAIAFLSTSAALYGSITPSGLLFVLVILLVLNPWLYRFSRSEHGVPSEEGHRDLELLRIDDRFLVSKLGDVLFQQTVFGMLVLMLQDMPLALLSVVCGLLLAIGHLGLVFRMPSIWSAYFIFSALIGGLALPWLILYVPAGFYYAIAFHMLWYTVTGVFHAKMQHRRE